VGTDTTDRITSAPVRSSLVRGWFARGRAGASAWRVSLNHAPSFSRQQPRVSWRQFFCRRRRRSRLFTSAWPAARSPADLPLQLMLRMMMVMVVSWLRLSVCGA